MRRAAAISAMRSSVLADRGLRFAGYSSVLTLSPPDGGSLRTGRANVPGGQSPLRASPDDDFPSDGPTSSPVRREKAEAAAAASGALNVTLSERGASLLVIIAPHFGGSHADTLTRALCVLADQVGLGTLLDGALAAEGLRPNGAKNGRVEGRDGQSPLRPAADLIDFECDDFSVGGAAVARRSHKPEVAGSNPAPATTITREGGLARLARPPAPVGNGKTVGVQPAARHQFEDTS